MEVQKKKHGRGMEICQRVCVVTYCNVVSEFIILPHYFKFCIFVREAEGAPTVYLSFAAPDLKIMPRYTGPHARSLALSGPQDTMMQMTTHTHTYTRNRRFSPVRVSL